MEQFGDSSQRPIRGHDESASPTVAARTAAGDGKEQIVKVESNNDPTLHYKVSLWGGQLFPNLAY